MNKLRDGDIVIRKPADPAEDGSGPFYVDCAEGYAGDTTRPETASSDTGSLPSALDAVRERHKVINEPCGDFAVVIGRFKRCTDDVPRLLAAVNEALALADAGNLDPVTLREAIAGALTREETGNGS